MPRIYKYPVDLDYIRPDSSVRIPMPVGSRVLSIQKQGGDQFLSGYQLWAEVDPAAPQEEVILYVIGTGHEVPADAGSYITTLVAVAGSLVLHFYLSRAQEARTTVRRPT